MQRKQAIGKEELEGKAEGRVEGRVEEKESVIVNGHQQGLTIDLLAKLTQLTELEVQQIIDDNL